MARKGSRWRGDEHRWESIDVKTLWVMVVSTLGFDFNPQLIM